MLTAPDGVRLHFQKLGTGPITVVIPSGFFLSKDFRRLADRFTVVFYDQRNRGRSDAVADKSKLERGIHHDVEDLEAVRNFLGIDQIAVIAHSYLGLMAILYAIRYPNRAARIVQIGAVPPSSSTVYPPNLSNDDDVKASILSKLAQLRPDPGEAPAAFRKRWWETLRPIYVANPADAAKITFDSFELDNESPLNAMQHWMGNILPSMERLDISADLPKVTVPVLTIHGKQDRSAPYGGGRDWAKLLPDARLLTLENAAHMPWIEHPETVFPAIETFLKGDWPAAAEKI